MININIILLIILLCYSGINPFVLLVILPILLVSIQMLQKLYNNYNKLYNNYNKLYNNYNKLYFLIVTLYFLFVTLFLFLIGVVYYIAIGGNMLSVYVDDYLSSYNIILFNETLDGLTSTHSILLCLFTSLTINYTFTVEINKG